MMGNSNRHARATWLAAAAIVAVLGGTPASAFDAGFTSQVTSNGTAAVEACRSKPDDQIKNCVADELDRVANRFRRKPDYTDARDAFRQAASSVRQASSTAAAASAVQAARSQLLSSGGEAASHNQQLAHVMDTARSVLRS